MNRIIQLLNSPYAFWAVLAWPSFGMMSALLAGETSQHDLLHPTGEFAARFMILAMMITLLRMLFAKHRWPLWLLRRRRYLGVAAFCYAMLHVIFYIVDLGSFSAVLTDSVKLSIWTGWVAFLIFVPLAMTSNDWAMRRLKQAWKPLQRWVYVATVFTLGHWIFLEYELGPALVHFLPLLALEAFRIIRNVKQSMKLAEA